MSDDASATGWTAVLKIEWLPALAIVLGGVLLHSMNVLLLATVLPSIVAELGGAAMVSWSSTAFLASSIVAATCSSLIAGAIGASRAFCVGALAFCGGTLLCALAPSMGQIIAGRFVQGFGGGMLSAVAYVVVRNVFPESLWPRVFGLMAGVWSFSFLVGPLVGGVFASFGDWRGAFYTVAVLGGVMALAALRWLPSGTGGSPSSTQASQLRVPHGRVPVGRIAFVCLAIAAMSLAVVLDGSAAKAALIILSVALLVLMVRQDGRAANRLLPSDAFSLQSMSGAALWVVLLLSMAFNPLQIFAPIFLQRLHGFDPLSAGYTVASASMAWTIAALMVAGLRGNWPAIVIIVGPLVMALGHAGIAILMPSGPLVPLILAIVLIGIGIGMSSAFSIQRVMSSAKPGEEDVAASSVATVQQTGLALGAALAGLAANAAGFSDGLDAADSARAAIWVSVSLVPGLLAAAAVGLVLRNLDRTPQKLPS
jgi:MFS family permease